MEEKNVTLHPVFAMHGYAVDMPSQSGAHTYRFRVHSGDIEIQHHSYDGIAGLWCLPPESGDRASIVLHSAPFSPIRRSTTRASALTSAWLLKRKSACFRRFVRTP